MDVGLDPVLGTQTSACTAVVSRLLPPYRSRFVGFAYASLGSL